MKFLGSDQWKSFLKIKSHLVSKTTLCACAGTICFMNAFIQNMLKQIEVLLHGCKLGKTEWWIVNDKQVLGNCGLINDNILKCHILAH